MDARGLTEISSALLHFLKNYINNAKHVNVCIFYDECGTQNKNNIVLHSLMDYLAQPDYSINEIMLHFPVQEHSFLSRGSTFGKAEKRLRKKITITTPEKYYSTHNDFGKVKKTKTKNWVQIKYKIAIYC